jgi:ABC-type multidrug transport system fused ATPase/permease subunit
MDFKVKKGSLVMVIGPVGSGKSSLFKTLLGEMHITKGRAGVNGKIGYFPQDSFLLNDTIKNNIIFGEEYDEQKFQRILSLCELDLDLNSLKAKEFTEIGENGINLSGGQKQRISIARGLYLESDIYLFDDCFSALDAHVGRKIFENVIMSELVNKGKTVVLNTHVLAFLEKADEIIFMKQGEVHMKGSFDDLYQNQSEFKEFISRKIIKNESDNSKTEIKLTSQTDEFIPNISQHESDILESSFDSDSTNKKGTLIKMEDSTPKSTNLQKIEEGKLTKKEHKEQGDIKRNVFIKYFTSGGVFFFLSILFLFILVTSISIFSEYWISVWTTNKFGLTQNSYIGIYGGILGFMLVINLLKGVFFGWYILSIGFELFNDLLKRIIKKPMTFFDTTPIGQLLNLTGKDSDFVDTFLAKYTGSVIDGFTRIFGVFILAGIANYFLVPFVIGKYMFSNNP